MATVGPSPECADLVSHSRQAGSAKDTQQLAKAMTIRTATEGEQATNCRPGSGAEEQEKPRALQIAHCHQKAVLLTREGEQEHGRRRGAGEAGKREGAVDRREWARDRGERRMAERERGGTRDLERCGEIQEKAFEKKGHWHQHSAAAADAKTPGPLGAPPGMDPGKPIR